MALIANLVRIQIIAETHIKIHAFVIIISGAKEERKTLVSEISFYLVQKWPLQMGARMNIHEFSALLLGSFSISSHWMTAQMSR